MLRQFPSKGGTEEQVVTNATGYWVGCVSGRRCITLTADNIHLVYELVLHKKWLDEK